MLVYFPQLYPDELLYSVFARYHQHRGSISPTQTSLELFGTSSAIASLNFPCHLGVLSSQLPDRPQYAPERLIAEHTLLPYLLAYARPEHHDRVVANIIHGSTDGLALLLGIVASQVKQVDQLRFCPACQREMVAQYGESYWCRTHQLPSVLLCPKHNEPLRLSHVILSHQNRHAYLTASVLTCPNTAPTLDVGLPSARSRLLLIAQRSAELLQQNMAAKTLSEWTGWYRQQLAEKGFLRHRHVDSKRLHDGIKLYYGDALQVLEGVSSTIRQLDWLDVLCRKQRKSQHPLYHILLSLFLDSKPSSVSVFGAGPWPCLNPLEQHLGECRISTISTHRNHGHTVGVFACDCGYAYTRHWDNEKHALSKPLPRHYGHTFYQLLSKYQQQRLGLRATARLLHVDPSTVKRERVRLNAFPDSGTSIDVSNKKSVLRKNPNLHHLPRTDWAAVDEALLTDFQQAVRMVLQETPPVRVTRKMLERLLDCVGWTEKRVQFLPKLSHYLAQVIESTADFQIRRLYWVVKKMQQQGEPIKAWRIRRLAHLPSNVLPEVENTLLRLVECSDQL